MCCDVHEIYVLAAARWLVDVLSSYRDRLNSCRKSCTAQRPVNRSLHRHIMLLHLHFNFCCLFDAHHLIVCPGEPPVRRKRLEDICYTRRVIGDFILHFACHGNGVGRVEFDWHHSIAHPRIPPTRRKRHRDIFYTSGVCFLSVLSQFSLPWQPGSVVVKFDWHHLITCPGNPLVDVQISLIEDEL